MFIKTILKKNVLTRPLYFKLLKCWQRHCVARDRKNLQKFGFAVLKKMEEVFDDGIILFPDCGTMLGLVRDGGFMKHDDDLDFSVVMSRDISPAFLLRKLLDNGFDYLSCYEHDNVIEQLAVSYNGIRVDVFLNKIDSEGRMYSSEFWGEVKKQEDGRLTLDCYRNYRPNIGKLITFDAHGVNIRIPENYEELLEAEYGQSWRVPDPNWKVEMRPFQRQRLSGKSYCQVPIERVYELG